MSTVQRPLRLYLDSSDFSVLSDPARSNREAPGVLDQLRARILHGEVECFFSAVHLTEMAPIEAKYADAARRRAEMLVSLCGRNAMVHIEGLFSGEVQAALGMAELNADPVDRNGGWFPEGVAEMSPVTAADHVRTVQDTIKELLPATASRAQRRQAKRMFVKSGELRPQLKQMLKANARSADVGEILKVYPMRPDAARVLANYVVGQASPEQATAAFESSLRDPSWMMQWFDKHHDKLNPVVAWARGPSAELTEKMMTLADMVEAARSNPLLTDDALASIYGPARWAEMQARMLTRLANRFAARFGEGLELAQDDIENCPGLTTAIRALFSAWRSITFERQRKPKPSDFVDALHAAYAPYVDLFRADGFMANYIAPRVTRFGTTVVPKLLDLPAAISKRLAVA